MPHAIADDGVKLYYEETGTGVPVIFVHEFAGDLTSWEAQLRHFGQRYHSVAYNARGYPQSDVPEDVGKYSQNRAADDIATVLDHLQLNRAHVVGLSMGGFATLHFGFRHALRARSLTVAGCGYGADPAKREDFRAEGASFAIYLDMTLSCGNVVGAPWTGAVPRDTRRDRDETREARYSSHRAGACGGARQAAAEPPGLPAVVPLGQRPAARPALLAAPGTPAVVLLLWSAPRRAAAAGPHPASKPQPRPVPTSCRNHPSRFPGRGRAFAGDRARPGRADQARPPSMRGVPYPRSAAG